MENSNYIARRNYKTRNILQMVYLANQLSQNVKYRIHIGRSRKSLVRATDDFRSWYYLAEIEYLCHDDYNTELIQAYNIYVRERTMNTLMTLFRHLNNWYHVFSTIYEGFDLHVTDIADLCNQTQRLNSAHLLMVLAKHVLRIELVRNNRNIPMRFMRTKPISLLTNLRVEGTIDPTTMLKLCAFDAFETDAQKTFVVCYDTVWNAQFRNVYVAYKEGEYERKTVSEEFIQDYVTRHNTPIVMVEESSESDMVTVTPPPPMNTLPPAITPTLTPYWVPMILLPEQVEQLQTRNVEFYPCTSTTTNWIDVGDQTMFEIIN